jgi:hypothetical protein
VCYSYVWHAQHLKGLEEGVKDRPCLIIAARTSPGGPVARIMPITHDEPVDKSSAVEIPNETKKRMGMDSKRSWIICSEANQSEWPGPDLRPVRRGMNKFDYGSLPPGLFAAVKEKNIDLIRSGRFLLVPRSMDLTP